VPAETIQLGGLFFLANLHLSWIPPLKPRNIPLGVAMQTQELPVSLLTLAAMLVPLLATQPLQAQSVSSKPETNPQVSIPAESREDAINRAAMMNRQAVQAFNRGEFETAREVLAETLRMRLELLGKGHANTLVTMDNYAAVLKNMGRAAEAEPISAEALRLRREHLGDDHHDTLFSINNYATILISLGRHAEAEPLLAEALRLRRAGLGNQHRLTIIALKNYADVLVELGQFSEAEPYYAESLSLAREVLGDEHRDTISSISGYGQVLRRLGRTSESAPYQEEAWLLRGEVLGERHPETLSSLHSYADLLIGLGRLDESELHFAEVLRLRQDVLGERHPNTLNSMVGYAYLLADRGRPAEAEPYFSDALSARREVLGERHPSTLGSLSGYAFVLYHLGRSAEAEPVYAEALRLRREELGNLHPATLNTMYGLANVLRRLGRAAQAEPLYVESLDGRRQVLGENHPATLSSLRGLATVLEVLGRSAEAESLYSQAEDARQQLLDERTPDSLRSLAAYAAALQSLGNSAEAATLYVQILSARRQILGERHPDTLSSLREYAGALKAIGQLAEAEPLYAEVLEARRETSGERDRGTIASLNDYAVILMGLGRTIEAEPLLAESLRLRREVLGDSHPTTIQSLINYSTALDNLGRTAEAEPLDAEALRLSRLVQGERHPETLNILNNYAFTLERLDRAAEAEPLFAESLRLRREQYGDRHRDTTLGIYNYARVLESLGRSIEAEPLFAEALGLRRQVWGESHPLTLRSLHGYAEMLASLGRAVEAEPHFAQALQLRRDVLGERHPDTLTSLGGYAKSLVEIGRPAEALPLARELSVSTRSRANDLGVIGVRGNDQRDREVASRQDVEKLLADALWANFEPSGSNQSELRTEAFTALQLASAGSTSRAVAEAAAVRFAAGQGLQNLVQERQRLTRNWSEIEATLVENQSSGVERTADRDSLRTLLRQVELRLDQIDERLETEAPQYFAILNQQTVELEQIRRVLGPEEAVLFLVPTQFGTHIMTVTDDGLSWARAAIDEAEMSSTVEQFRVGLEIRADDPNLPFFDLDWAHELYTQLVGPAERALQGKSRVYVVGGGALSRLPLGTLLTSPPPANANLDDVGAAQGLDWLADRYALVQLPSLQSLVYIRSFGEENPEQSAGERFQGFGDPVLSGESRLRGARSATLAPVDAASLVSKIRGSGGNLLMNPTALRQLSRLPGTRSELEQVREALGASEGSLYLAEQMTETAIRDADLSNTLILHLATHGFTSEESGGLAEPGLIFTPPGTAQPLDDGYLAASEVVGLNLTSAQWVILSACNTAAPSGGSDGTGLSGLAQAFFYAGAESLLVSHWPVFDEIAPILTVEVLKRSQDGQARAEALQAVMREIRNNPALDAAHPAVWAPFALVGDGR